MDEESVCSDNLDVLLDFLDGDHNAQTVKTNASQLEKCEVGRKPEDRSNVSHANEHLGSAVPSCSGDHGITESDVQGYINNPEIDPLEAELAAMEERMRRLKEELCKRKNLTKTPISKIGFTKLSSVVEQPIETIRILDDREKDELLRKVNASTSVVHTGDTDSEDDEDNRNPMEPQLSSSGRGIKRRLAYASDERILSERTKVFSEVTNASQRWKEAKGGSLLALGKKLAKSFEDEEKVHVDSFSGIRLVNPLVSDGTMKDLMQGRRMIRMSSITLHLRGGDVEGDWVTVGVIVSKSEAKTSQKGSQYSIWQLSDLCDCTKVVSLFLFADAHKQLWKTAVGSVVGILNAEVMKERQDAQRHCLTLSVNTAQKILLMGTCKDLGWCKGRTKVGQCRQFVNKNVCEFCVYHIQREYKKTSSRRADIQSSFSRVDPKKALQRRVLGKNQVFYGGQIYGTGTAVKAPASASRLGLSSAPHHAKDLATLSCLKIKHKAQEMKQEEEKKVIPYHLSQNQRATVNKVTEENEGLGRMLLAPTPGALQFLRYKSTETPETATKASPKMVPQELSAKELLNATKLEKKRQSMLNSSLGVKKSPQLGRGIKPGKDLELEVSPPSTKMSLLKCRAASIVSARGGLEMQPKNMKRSKEKSSSTEFQESIRKRLKTTLDDKEDTELQPREECTVDIASLLPKRTSLLGAVDINSEEFKVVMNAKSKHSNLIQVAEDEEVEKYYSSLEKKEMLENKMISVMEVKMSAAVCLTCKYKAFSVADRCREENHIVKSVQATKRFFECRNCKRRTASLEKLPARACSNCSQSSWKRVGMGKEKQGPQLESEVLSLRGDELTHCSGSSSHIYLHL